MKSIRSGKMIMGVMGRLLIGMMVVMIGKMLMLLLMMVVMRLVLSSYRLMSRRM
jgi:hypothetical protein